MLLGRAWIFPGVHGKEILENWWNLRWSGSGSSGGPEVFLRLLRASSDRILSISNSWGVEYFRAGARTRWEAWKLYRYIWNDVTFVWNTHFSFLSRKSKRESYAWMNIVMQQETRTKKKSRGKKDFSENKLRHSGLCDTRNFQDSFFRSWPPIRKLSKLPNEMLHVEVRHRHHKNVVVKDQDQFSHW